MLKSGGLEKDLLGAGNRISEEETLEMSLVLALLEKLQIGANY